MIRNSLLPHLLIAILLAVCTYSQNITEPLNDRVLVVYDSLSPGSKSVAEYYMRRRGIPKSNLCRIRVGGPQLDSLAVSIPWNSLNGAIKRPIRKCLDAVGRDKILYVVFSYGTPYRLTAVPTHFGTAIDQYVADIWDQAGTGIGPPNPYFAKQQSRRGIYTPFISLADFRMLPGSKLVYSVWRLDAANPALARGLVDKAIAAEASGLQGRACIDRRDARDIREIQDQEYGAGEWSLFRAGEFLKNTGILVEEDHNSEEFGTPPAPLRCDDAIFYAGWYSLNHYNDAFTWAPGAIGIHLDSESATDPRGGSNWSANAVIKGITVTAGAIDEPLLPGLPHVDGIVHDLLEGANVGDAFLRNTMPVRWMIVNIGDPLYKPQFTKSRDSQ